MTSVQITLPVAGTAPAVLTLPQPLTPAALRELERAVAGTLGMLRRDLHGAAETVAAERAAHRQAAGEIEYASWMPDAGAIEYASWTAQLQTLRQ